MNIKDLAKKYNLDPENDFWELVRGNTKKWIILHSASERIATMEGIIFDVPEVHINEDHTAVAMIGKARLGDIETWSTGEAAPHNCKNPHFVAMSEKRLRGRLILKLIEAYQYGIYSEDEADAFRRTDK